ncbi:MAG: hypothetical protein JRI61_01820, partial [Deltaproteobacteria bacterium]|nr:hypothetical protein [Deltaproteobacteria bacterium]
MAKKKVQVQGAELKNKNHTRMTGMDQILWNMVYDQNFFCIWGISTLRAPLKDDIIEKTLEYLIATIPILNSKPEFNWFNGRWKFIEKKDVKDLILRIKTKTDEEAKERVNKLFVNPIDSTKVSMIRLISIDGLSKHYFVFQVHHLVLDGEGLKRLCVKFAEIYKELHNDNRPEPTTVLDPNRSWWQIAKTFGLRHVWLIHKTLFINSYEVIRSKVLKRTKYNLSGDFKINEKSISPSSPYFESIVVEKDIMLKLKAFGKDQKYTVNDILMTSFSLAISKWNKDRGDNREWLKFGYTVNMRRWWGEPSGTFGNFSAVLLFEEMNKNLKDPATALASIKKKVDKVKKRIGLDCFAILAYLKFIPYFCVRKVSLSLKEKLFAFLRYNHAMTNIGIVFEEAGDFGHTEALNYSFLAPTFPGGCMIFTITTYKNVTTIYIACNEDYFKNETANIFLKG